MQPGHGCGPYIDGHYQQSANGWAFHYHNQYQYQCGSGPADRHKCREPLIQLFMKRAVFILSLALGAVSVFAQNNPVVQQQPNNYNNQPANAGTYNTNVSTPAPVNVPQGVTFTNKTGTAYSVEQLANQLRTLQTSVDQTLPVLSAFNENFISGSDGASIGGALSNLVTSVLRKNNTSSSGQIPAAVTSLIAAMRGQSGGAISVPANATKDLATLQNDLQPIPGLLQDLNPGGTSPNPSQIISSPANAATTNGVPRNLAPTGR